MSRRLPLLCLLLLLGSCASVGKPLVNPASQSISSLQSGNFALDPAASVVRARVKAFAVSTRLATFPKMNGSLKIDSDKPGQIGLDVTIDATALQTAEKGDADILKGDSFFDVKNHPQLKFAGGQLTQSAGANPQLAGEMTVRGVTKPVTLQVSFGQSDASGMNFTATTRIDRRDFGMTEYDGIVANDVAIEIEARLLRQ
jgi:polyisoprenoid-binding protein YceI